MKDPVGEIVPAQSGTAWIDELTDEQCMEIFWLYVDPPEPFLAGHPPALLGQAMRYALKCVAEASDITEP
ncbi:MAG: hypothetical protein ACE5HT_02805 [Gemmatimonadales bacterium]